VSFCHPLPCFNQSRCRYYGQLSKQEIFDLYDLYRLDHELFGYSPEEFFKLARDA